jgi:serine/threonine protein kinase
MPLNETPQVAPDEDAIQEEPVVEGGLPAITGYTVLQTLGEGAMGAVYLAIEENLGRRVAIKVLKEDYGDAPGAQAQFEREAKSMATVEHPHVVRVYAFGEAGTAEHPRPYLAMEFVEGSTLEERIRQSGGLNPEQALRIITESAQALRAAWRKRIVHRDVKPGNIFLDLEDRVRVGDFGIAKPLEMAAGHYTASGVTLGTPLYLAPEQALGEDLDFRADMYSLGIVLWETLVGHPPFEDTNSMQLIKRHLIEAIPTLTSAGFAASPTLENLVQKMTAKERSNRFESYEELLEAIESALDGPPDSSHSAGRSQGWYYACGGDKVGPVAHSELLAMIVRGDINPDTYVWGPGFDEWLLAGDKRVYAPDDAHDAADPVGDDGLAEDIMTTGAHEAFSLLSAHGKSSSILSEMANADIRSKPIPTLSPSAFDQLNLGRVTEEEPNEEATATSFWQTGPQQWSPPSNGADSSTAASEEASDAVSASAAIEAVPIEDSGDDDGSFESERVADSDRGAAVAVLSNRLHYEDMSADDDMSAEEVEEAAEPGAEDQAEGDATVDSQGLPPLPATAEFSPDQLEAARALTRFQVLKKTSFRPAMRNQMSRLRVKGHPSLLRDVSARAARLEIVVAAHSRGTLEVELTEEGTIALRVLKNSELVLEELLTFDELLTVDVQSRLPELLKDGLGIG